MSTDLDEALEWFQRAEQAREVVVQLADPGARNAVLRLAENLDRLGREAVTSSKENGITKASVGTHDFPLALSTAPEDLFRAEEPNEPA